MALFTGVQHLYTFNIVPPLIYHLLPNVWKVSYTISLSVFVDILYWLSHSMDKFISCVVPGPSQWFFHFGEEIVIAWTHRVSTVDVPESHIASGARGPWQQQLCDSLHCYEGWWDSVPPSVVSVERWMKVVLQNVQHYRLPWRYSVVQYCPINAMHPVNITFTAHYVGRTFFRWGEPECFHSFHWCFKCGSYERAQVSSLTTIGPRKSSPYLWYRSSKACASA